jgi:hypothetical protein
MKRQRKKGRREGRREGGRKGGREGGREEGRAGTSPVEESGRAVGTWERLKEGKRISV